MHPSHFRFQIPCALAAPCWLVEHVTIGLEKHQYIISLQGSRGPIVVLEPCHILVSLTPAFVGLMLAVRTTFAPLMFVVDRVLPPRSTNQKAFCFVTLNVLHETNNATTVHETNNATILPRSEHHWPCLIFCCCRPYQILHINMHPGLLRTLNPKPGETRT